MNNLTLLGSGQRPAAFANQANLPDMNAAAQAGLSAGFAVIGYKGRNWRIKHRGDEELLKDSRGVPIPTLEVVIVGLSPAVSKQWYDKRYSEGDAEAPDCFSLDGIAPDPTSKKLQCATCAACPQNVFGSKITEVGKKAKACQDSRRVAVVPLGDITNESYGGPMLLRIPTMSLANLARYCNDLTRFSAQPYMVQTILGFDYDVAYPLITFKAGGWLSEDQAREVAQVMGDPLIKRMLEQGDPAEHAATPAQDASPLAGGGPAASFRDIPPLVAKPAIDHAKAAEVAEANARAKAEADEKIRMRTEVEAAEARAKAAKPAETKPAAKKPTPFAQAQAATQAPPAQTQAPTQVTQAEPARAEAVQEPEQVQPAAQTTTVVAGMPADLESAIDNLLGV